MLSLKDKCLVISNFKNESLIVIPRTNAHLLALVAGGEGPRRIVVYTSKIVHYWVHESVVFSSQARLHSLLLLPRTKYLLCSSSFLLIDCIGLASVRGHGATAPLQSTRYDGATKSNLLLSSFDHPMMGGRDETSARRAQQTRGTWKN
jgi:hypothetical protein